MLATAPSAVISLSCGARRSRSKSLRHIPHELPPLVMLTGKNVRWLCSSLSDRYFTDTVSPSVIANALKSFDIAALSSVNLIKLPSSVLSVIIYDAAYSIAPSAPIVIR